MKVLLEKENDFGILLSHRFIGFVDVYQMKGTDMKQVMLSAILASVLTCVSSSALADNDYQYIISGVPVANPSQSLASDGIPLATGRYTRRSAESPLEARYRTFFASAGGKLLSTKFIASRIVVQ